MARTDYLKKVMRSDNYRNFVTGMGTRIDKSMYDHVVAQMPTTDIELELLYHENDLAGRICDIYPEDALKKGFEITIETDDKQDYDSDQVKEQEGDIKAALEGLETVASVTDALVWANVFGGCAILPGIMDGSDSEDLIEPLDLSKVEAVTHLTVLDRRYLQPWSWYSNTLEPNFGKPRTYMVSPIPITSSNIDDTIFHEVHETRLIIFDGARTSLLRKQRNSGWSESILQRASKAIRKFDVSFDDITAIAREASLSVMKMAGLIDSLAANDRSVIDARMELMNTSRSVHRTVVLDAEMEEEFSKVSSASDFVGIHRLFIVLMMRLSAATGIPSTKLFGKSPEGMNSTGEFDLRNWYDEIEAYQLQVIKPRLEYLIKIILSAKQGPTQGIEPENWTIKFKSQYTQTEKEIAETRKITAETDAIYINNDVVLPEEVAASRFSPAGWSMDTNIDMAAREELAAATAELEKSMQLQMTPNPEKEEVEEVEEVEEDKEV